MNTGDRIKQRRLELGLSADDLGAKIGKSRATIYRYENGDIENMPTPVLEPLAKALDTTPADLMGWEGQCIKSNIEDRNIPWTVSDKPDNNQKELNEIFLQLSSNNQQRVLTYSKTLLSTQQMEEELLPDAANDRNATEEEKKHADDIMFDDSEWE
ncbi:helix-turn-helix domain-containing protein [Blautia faecis]|uniref:helix-turn-helix domain-containing protein n=1 Tax=Blautia faecis TaxID=871665 RepID=UPI0022E10D3B|nr:helix-turn-helix transcriptional regulator [Blautia faecis]